jgi:hypothetical protein
MLNFVLVYKICGTDKLYEKNITSYDELENTILNISHLIDIFHLYRVIDETRILYTYLYKLSKFIAPNYIIGLKEISISSKANNHINNIYK